MIRSQADRSSRLGLALLVVAGFASGCSRCDGGPVPFAVDPAVGDDRDPRAEGRAEVDRPTGASRSFPVGTSRVEVEGAPITVDGSIRALFASDLDGDGDRDAILVIEGPEGEVSLAFARRDGAGFAAPRELGRAPGREGCAIEEASVRALEAGYGLARAALRCEHEDGVETRVEHWIVSLEASPRALEHIALLPARGRAPGTITLEASSADHDEDGHADVLFALTLEDGTERSEIVLPWLNRPSGLARDAGEPEATFEARSREGLRALRGAPARALARSREVTSLHAALCRESGRARLQIGGGQPGLPCGTSRGAGRAAATVVRALAARGALVEALDALEQLEGPGLEMTDERREAVQTALAQAPASGAVSMRRGPSHDPPVVRGVSRTSLRFDGEDALVLAGADESRRWAIDEDTISPSDEPPERRLLDPSGRFAIVGVERRCAGHVLRIARAESVVAGQALGATHAAPLVVRRDPPPGAPCPDLTPTLRDDDGGLRVLGWAPQGVVSARGASLFLTPLDVEGRPAGESQRLGASELPPAPLEGGPVSRDGRYHVEIRAGRALLLHRVAPNPEASLLWPEGWGELEGPAREAAVSPSGRRVAVVRAGRVWLLERAAD